MEFSANNLERVSTLAAPFSPDPITDEEAAAMFRAALNLFRLWRLTDADAALLLDLPLRTFRRWKGGDCGRIGRDGKARLSNLMGIHKALRIIFAEPQRGYCWISQPNAAFGGKSALDVMRGGELTDIMRVRRYLDAERGLG
ncbi:MAG TPA: MbcA/ParS/Xre antitoxin family protein [Rhizobiaceae bacterium]|nr:MbcA/ParS/Xre antitoxin family protein [Rhizobiaceae bacterium]